MLVVLISERLLVVSCMMQKRVQQLKQDVNEWKESYDLLMKELRKMSLERVVEREQLVKEVNTGAKVCANIHTPCHMTVM